jgi:hypothetical protein
MTMDYSKEPARDEANTAELRVLEKEPFNAEPGDLGKLIQHEVTPECLAYVRNHGECCLARVGSGGVNRADRTYSPSL